MNTQLGGLDEAVPRDRVLRFSKAARMMLSVLLVQPACMFVFFNVIPFLPPLPFCSFFFSSFFDLFLPLQSPTMQCIAQAQRWSVDSPFFFRRLREVFVGRHRGLGGCRGGALAACFGARLRSEGRWTNLQNGHGRRMNEHVMTCALHP